MADKSVGELIAAQSVTPTDLFVLEQNGTAKKLTGQILENWLVSFADGHGGIQSIVKIETNVLADTYRITLADTTTFDFVVTNGKGISNVVKTETSGLVDTYTITYNDGTTGTFTVTNGAKGDQGDNAYIWVKYASQEPTSSDISLGDIPDEWMGIYFGTSSTAPDSYSSYKWYKIKGETGNTGAPATLVSYSVTYQVGDSGTIIPSGSWSESIPPVPQGKYLWTKEVIQFNTGNPITKYSVSRFGIDGTGAVSTVSGISPDATGNVPLAATDVKALPIGGGTMNGPINMNGQKLSGLNAPTADNDSATKGYVDTNKVDKANVVNNFTTTEEGFVADARALKTLNDSKMSMELLWENASQESTFAAQIISLDLSCYKTIKIVHSYGEFNVSVGSFSAPMYYSAERLAENSTPVFYSRGFTVNSDGVVCTDGFYTYPIANAVSSVSNSVLIPLCVYGIKGVS